MEYLTINELPRETILELITEGKSMSMKRIVGGLDINNDGGEVL